MKLQKDPLGDRVLKDVPQPVSNQLNSQAILNDVNPKEYFNIDLLGNFLLKEGRLLKDAVLLIIKKATQILKNEPNLQYLSDPVVIIGDIHGQFHDMMKMLSLEPRDFKNEKFVFLGDYVDRGIFGFEVVMYLLAQKVNYPKNVFQIRGNHESREMTSHFNFRQEALLKYDQEVYDSIMDCFDNLPLSACINNKFLCLHGGLSPQQNEIQDIERSIDRFQEIPKQGLGCDLIWADPIDDASGEINSNSGFRINQGRGCSFVYGAKSTQKFQKKNKLLTIIRAHEPQCEGFKCHHWGKAGMPPVITQFSAPNYCDSYGNKAAIIKIKKGILDVQQFEFIGHPYFQPDNMDCFEWSQPFITQKIVDLFYHVSKLTEKTKDQNQTIREEAKFQAQISSGELDQFMIPDKSISSSQHLDSNHLRNSQIQSNSQVSSQLHKLAKVDMNGETVSTEDIQKIKAKTEQFEKVKRVDSVNEIRPGSSQNSPIIEYIKEKFDFSEELEL